jgi:hypothetical protein
MSDGTRIAKYVGMGCGLMLLLGLCCGGGAFALFSSTLGEPHRYAHGFLDDVRAGNYPAALQRMGASYQATHDAARFQQAVAALPPLTQQTDATLSSVNVDGTVANVSGALTTPQGVVPIVLVLSQGGEYWYVEQVQVGGVPLM